MSHHHAASWKDSVKEEDRNQYLQYTLKIISENPYFKDNPKFPRDILFQIANYFWADAWARCTSPEDFVRILEAAPRAAEQHYRSMDTGNQPTPEQNQVQPQQQQTTSEVSTQQQRSHSVRHHDTQHTPKTVEQIQQMQPVAEQGISQNKPEQPSPKREFWETWIQVKKKKVADLDVIAKCYKQLKESEQLMSRNLHKKREELKHNPDPLKEKEILLHSQSLKKTQELIAALKTCFTDFHEHYTTFFQSHSHLENKEKAAFENLIEKSHVDGSLTSFIRSIQKKAMEEVNQVEEAKKEAKEREQIRHEATHLLDAIFFNKDALFPETPRDGGEKEKTLIQAVSSLRKSIGVPLLDDLVGSDSSTKRKLGYEPTSELPHKIRKGSCPSNEAPKHCPFRDYLHAILSAKMDSGESIGLTLSRLTSSMTVDEEKRKKYVHFKNISNLNASVELDIRFYPLHAVDNILIANSCVGEEDFRKSIMSPSSSSMPSPAIVSTPMSESSENVHVNIDEQPYPTDIPSQAPSGTYYSVEIALVVRLYQTTYAKDENPINIYEDVLEQSGLVSPVPTISLHKTELTKNIVILPPFKVCVLFEKESNTFQVEDNLEFCEDFISNFVPSQANQTPQTIPYSTFTQTNGPYFSIANMNQFSNFKHNFISKAKEKIGNSQGRNKFLKLVQGYVSYGSHMFKSIDFFTE